MLLARYEEQLDPASEHSYTRISPATAGDQLTLWNRAHGKKYGQPQPLIGQSTGKSKRPPRTAVQLTAHSRKKMLKKGAPDGGLNFWFGAG